MTPDLRPVCVTPDLRGVVVADCGQACRVVGAPGEAGDLARVSPQGAEGLRDHSRGVRRRLWRQQGVQQGGIRSAKLG